MTDLKDSTPERIKAAAWDVFVEKGRDGARMQEIAERAGANKAMIYYYFTSKDALFEEILRDIFRDMFRSDLGKVLRAAVEPEELIRTMVETYMDFLIEHPHLPRVILRESQAGHSVARNVLMELFEEEGLVFPAEFAKVLRKNARVGKLRKVDPQQTILSFLGMCLFYFVARSIITELWDMKADQEAKFITKRKRAIIDLMLNGLLPR